VLLFIHFYSPTTEPGVTFCEPGSSQDKFSASASTSADRCFWRLSGSIDKGGGTGGMGCRTVQHCYHLAGEG
jgi:hypothetical protein